VEFSEIDNYIAVAAGKVMAGVIFVAVAGNKR